MRRRSTRSARAGPLARPGAPPSASEPPSSGSTRSPRGPYGRPRLRGRPEAVVRVPVASVRVRASRAPARAWLDRAACWPRAQPRVRFHDTGVQPSGWVLLDLESPVECRCGSSRERWGYSGSSAYWQRQEQPKKFYLDSLRTRPTRERANRGRAELGGSTQSRREHAISAGDRGRSPLGRRP